MWLYLQEAHCFKAVPASYLFFYLFKLSVSLSLILDTLQFTSILTLCPTAAVQTAIALQPPNPLSLLAKDFPFIPFYDLHITLIRSSAAPTPSPRPLFQCNSREAEGTSSSWNPVLHSDKKTCHVILDLSWFSSVLNKLAFVLHASFQKAILTTSATRKPLIFKITPMVLFWFSTGCKVFLKGEIALLRGAKQIRLPLLPLETSAL